MFVSMTTPGGVDPRIEGVTAAHKQNQRLNGLHKVSPVLRQTDGFSGVIII